MMKVKVTELGSAVHPSEVVVKVQTISGNETLVIDRRSLKNGTILIGQPIRQEAGSSLIELPREAQSGSWRVWVKEDQLVEEGRLRA